MDKYFFLCWLFLFILLISPVWANDRWDLDLGLNAGIGGGPRGVSSGINAFNPTTPELGVGVDFGVLYNIAFNYSADSTSKKIQVQPRLAVGLTLGYARSISESNWTSTYHPLSFYLKGIRKGKYLQIGLYAYSFTSHYGPYGENDLGINNWGDGRGYSLALGAEQTGPELVQLGVELSTRIPISARERGHNAPAYFQWNKPVPVDYGGLFLTFRFKPNFF